MLQRVVGAVLNLLRLRFDIKGQGHNDLGVEAQG